MTRVEMFLDILGFIAFRKLHKKVLRNIILIL